MPVVNRGAVPGDQNADTAYAAFGKVNDKFDAVDLAVAAKADGAATTAALAGKADAAATTAALAGKADAAATTAALAGKADAAATTAALAGKADAAATTAALAGKADAAATTAALAGKADAAATTAALALKANVEVGMIVQTVAASSSTRDTTTVAIPVDNTVPQITEGKEYLTVTITPKFANSKIRVRASCNVSHNTALGTLVVALFADATANAIGAKVMSLAAADLAADVLVVAEHTPGDTAAHTYRLRFGPTSGAQTAAINGSSTVSWLGAAGIVTLVAEEIKV